MKIRVTVTSGTEFLDEITFDDANVVHHDGPVAIVSRDIMKQCTRSEIWHRVAHAAAWVAKSGSLLDLLVAERTKRLAGKPSAQVARHK
jgi:hypothetical protein